MMRYLLLFLLCSLSTAHAQVIVTDTSTYQHVKHYMKVDKTYCGGMHTLDAIFPYMQTNHYQVVRNPKVFSGGQVRDNAEGGNKYIGYSLHSPELQQLGDVFDLGMSFDVATININVNFGAIDQIYPYDTTSKEYIENTGDLTDCVLPHHPHIEAIANELWGQSNDIIDYARRCYEYTATHLNYLDANTGIHSLQSIIDNGGGDCGNFSSYYISLLRNRDIPSRHVVAVMGQDNYHVWAEFYLQDYGWIPVDPTFKHGDPNGDYFGHKNSPHYITTLGIELTDYKFAADSEPMQLQLMQLLYYMWWCYDPCTSTEFNFKIVRENIKTESITIGKSGKASYCGDKSLDFSYSDEVKAYIATGYDKDEGTIWLTRVKDVPAGVPVLIKGVAEKTYEVPVTDSQNSYYKNMFKGNNSGESVKVEEKDGDLVNYYLSGDGVFKSVKGYVNIGNNKCYLQLPGTFNAAVEGSAQTVKIGDSGKASYAAPVDLDFTNVEGLKAFTATGYDKSTKTIWLTRVMKVQKGEGVLLKGDPNSYEIPSAAVQSSYENMFVGNTSGDEIQVLETSEDGSQTNYYLKGDGSFVSVNGYVNIKNNKCYLALPTSMVAVSSTRSAEDDYKFEEPEVIKLSIDFKSIGSEGDGTTGIKNLTPALSKGEGEWYTLQGQRVAKPGKGLYIRNGKKVVIK